MFFQIENIYSFTKNAIIDFLKFIKNLRYLVLLFIWIIWVIFPYFVENITFLTLSKSKRMLPKSRYIHIAILFLSFWGYFSHFLCFWLFLNWYLISKRMFAEPWVIWLYCLGYHAPIYICMIWTFSISSIFLYRPPRGSDWNKVFLINL